MVERHYKGYRVYAYIALARLFTELDLDLAQPDVVDRATDRLAEGHGRLSKEAILHAIRSNSHMTEKVLDHLTQEGHATVVHDDRGYDIRITPRGVAHLAQYHRLYRDLYARELTEHYRFGRTPTWMDPKS